MNEREEMQTVEAGRHESAAVPTLELQEEFGWLMSLALDDMLEAEEARRFAELAARYPQLAALWVEWQQLDQLLDTQPHEVPAPGFMQRFEARLAVQERHRAQWAVVIMAVSVLVACAGLLLGLVGVGALLMLTQGGAMGEQLRQIWLFLAVLDHWVGSAAGALGALMTTPLARSLGLVYAISAVLIIVGWVQFLRQSARFSQSSTALTLD